MLNAILRNKAGREALSDGSSNTIYDMFRWQEDIRTSTVFERLMYFPPDLAWNVLQQASKSLPHFRMATIVSTEFWPSFPCPDDGRLRAEPDVFIRWELGDPIVRYDMIVEAKLPWTKQDVTQHEAQLSSYLAQFSGAGDCDSETEEDLADHVIYLCVDGLGNNPQREVTTISPRIPDGMPPVTIAACSWQDLADVVGHMNENGDFAEVADKLVRDIAEALAFCGHRYFAIDDTVLSAEAPTKYKKSLRSIHDWNCY